MQRFRISIEVIVEIADPLELRAAWARSEVDPAGVRSLITHPTSEDLEKDVLWLLAMGQLHEGKRGYRLEDLTASAHEETEAL